MLELDISKFSLDDIDKAINVVHDEFSSTKGVDMTRMSTQIKYAKEVILLFHKGHTNIIMSAPTGFGKSLMAFFISKVFNHLRSLQNESHNTVTNDAYILTANKILQKQYRDDVKWLRFDDTKMLQGQSNYKCDVNGLPFTQRPCHESSLRDLMAGKTEWKCAHTCAYLNARSAAIESPSTILNYHYWLTSMNYVFASSPRASFTPRNITIFDECHVLGNIVQDMFTSSLNVNSYIRKTYTAFTIISNRLSTRCNISFESFSALVNISEKLYKKENDTYFIFNTLKELNEELVHFHNEYAKLCKVLMDRLPKNANGQPMKNDDEIEIFKYLKFMNEHINTLGALINLYSELGHDTIVFQHEKTNDTKNKPITELGNFASIILKFQCTHEAELIKKAVHKYTKYAIFMSATIGDADAWAEQTGLTNYAFLEVPQVFDYSKSPIVSVLPMISMSYRNKTLNTPLMIQRIMKIIESHPNENGIVHTGNYQIANEIAKLRHPRIVVYSNAAEKEQLVNLLRTSVNTVVVGPSLIEGIDLKDNLCRFMIWAKVPYMSLGDKLTKRKMEIYKNWYTWVTLMSFLQGLGRGIRNNKDWCKTYLLDDSFTGFFQRAKLPSWVKSRMSYAQITNLKENYDPNAELNDALKDLR